MEQLILEVEELRMLKMAQRFSFGVSGLIVMLQKWEKVALSSKGEKLWKRK